MHVIHSASQKFFVYYCLHDVYTILYVIFSDNRTGKISHPVIDLYTFNRLHLTN